MKIVKPSWEIVTYTKDLLDNIEGAARICYLSEPKKTACVVCDDDGSMRAEMICRGLEQESLIMDKVRLGHESVLEHSAITVDIICDRGVSHELVRHRVASYSQESTRCCNYSKGKFGSELTFIKPCFWNDDSIGYHLWHDAMNKAEAAYLRLVQRGARPEEARSVLPNSLKTKIRITANVREWRHIFMLRALGLSGKPHPQMLEIMIPLLREFADRWPCLFNDLAVQLT